MSIGDPTSTRLARWVSFSCDRNDLADKARDRNLGKGAAGTKVLRWE